MLIELVTIMAPIFIIILLGFLIGKQSRVTKSHLKILTNLLIFVFVPALVFTSTIKNTIIHNTLIIIIFAMFIVSIVGIVSSFLARIMKLDKKSKSGFMLTAMFMNSGSMGSVICLILFGENGFLLAIMFYITTQVLLYTVGVIIASHEKSSFTLSALKPILTLPLIYALIIGFVFHYFNIQLSENALRPISLLSGAAVPLLLITLGMQLSKIKVNKETMKLPMVSAAVRIGLGFTVAFVITAMIGIGGIERDVIVICSAMPTKITTYPIAAKFGTNSEGVSMTILFSTMISIITTPIVLIALGVL
jgi:predicted permease